MSNTITRAVSRFAPLSRKPLVLVVAAIVTLLLVIGGFYLVLPVAADPDENANTDVVVVDPTPHSIATYVANFALDEDTGQMDAIVVSFEDGYHVDNPDVMIRAHGENEWIGLGDIVAQDTTGDGKDNEIIIEIADIWDDGANPFSIRIYNVENPGEGEYGVDVSAVDAGFEPVGTDKAQYDIEDVGYWKHFQADIENTGVADSQGPDGPVTAKWWYDNWGGSISSPVVAYDRVMFGNEGSGGHRALDMDGNHIWSSGTGGTTTRTTQTVFTNMVIGGNDHRDYRAEAVPDGEFFWQQNTRSEAPASMRSSPVVDENEEQIYLALTDGELYKDDANVNDNFADTPTWNQDIPGPVTSSPALGPDHMFIANENDNLYAIDRADGSIAWTVNIGGAKYSSSTYEDGMVYIGGETGDVHAISVTEQAIEWSSSTGDRVRSSPAIADGVVYVGSDDNRVYAFDAEDGSSIWDYETDGGVFSSPAVDGDRVYVGSNDSNVYAIDRIDGSEVWSFETEASVMASPAVADGIVYVGTTGDFFYALEETDSELNPDPEADGDLGLQTDSDVVGEETTFEYTFEVADNNDELQRFEVDMSDANHPGLLDNVTLWRGEITIENSAGKPVEADIDLYSSTDDFYSDTIEIVLDERPDDASEEYTITIEYVRNPNPATFEVEATALIGGTEIAWDTTFFETTYGNTWAQFRGDTAGTGTNTEVGPEDNLGETWTFETEGAIESSPAVHGERVYVASGDADGTVYALDSSTAEADWTFEMGGPVQRESPLVSSNYVILGSTNTEQVAIEHEPWWEEGSFEDNDHEWSFNTGDPIRSSATLYDGLVYFGSNDNFVYAVTTEGDEAWSFEAGGRVESSPAVLDGITYVGSNDGEVYAIDEEGNEDWSFLTGDMIVSSPAVVDDTVYVGSMDNNVYALDASDAGNELWSFETDDAVVSSPAVDDDSVFVGSQDNTLYAIDDEGEERWSFETDDDIDASPAVVNDVVYFGSADSTLYALDATDGEVLWAHETDGVISSSPAVVQERLFVGTEAGTLYAFEGDELTTGGSVDDGNEEDEEELEEEPTINVSSSSIDFGGVDVGEKSSEELTIENQGIEELSISDIVLDGDNVFEVEDSLSLVEPGESESIDVSFEPTAAEEYNATVVIESNDPDDGEVGVELTGVGTKAVFQLERTDVDFGSVAVDGNYSEDVRIWNNGTATLEIDEILSSGDDAFSVDEGSVSVSAQSSETVRVRYSPTELTDHSGTLTFAYADNELGSVEFEGEARERSLSVEPDSIEYGNVSVGDSATDQMLISTDQDFDVEIENLTLAGDGDGVFEVEEGDDVVGPDDTVVRTKTFSPHRPGEYDARVEVHGPDGREGTVELIGAATAPEMTVTPRSLQFEDIEVDETATETVTVGNTGDEGETLEITRANLSENEAFTLAGGGEFELQAGESHDLDITFAPETEEQQSAQLTLSGNDPLNRNQIVYVSSGNVEANVTVDEQDRITTEAVIRDAKRGEPARLDLPSPVDDEEYQMENLEIIPDEDGDIEINTTSSSRELDTTPDERAGFGNATSQRGNLSVESNLEREQIQEVSFEYTMDKSELEALDSSPEDVDFYRFDEDAERWEQKPTEIVDENGDEVTFRSNGTGFSEWTAAAQRPDFDVTDTQIEVTTAEVDQELLIQVIVTNWGGADGTYEAELLFNEEVVDSESRTVPANGTVPINFERSFDAPGLYDVLVNDVFIAEVEITESGDAEVEQGTEDGPPPLEEEPDPADDPEDDGVGWVGIGLLLLILAVIGGAVAYMVRRRTRGSTNRIS